MIVFILDTDIMARHYTVFLILVKKNRTIEVEVLKGEYLNVVTGNKFDIEHEQLKLIMLRLYLNLYLN